MANIFDLLEGKKPEPETQSEPESCDLIQKINPFEFLNTINTSKTNLIAQSECPDLMEKEYNPWLMNRGLSYFYDSIGFANLMNVHHYLDKKLQYEFLLNTIRPRTRKGKWTKKKEVSSDIAVIQKAYNYSYKKAEIALSLLSTDALDYLKQKQKQGGLKK